MEATYVPISGDLKIAYPRRKSRKAHVGKKINSIWLNDEVSSCIWVEWAPLGKKKKRKSSLSKGHGSKCKACQGLRNKGIRVGFHQSKWQGKKSYKRKKKRERKKKQWKYLPLSKLWCLWEVESLGGRNGGWWQKVATRSQVLSSNSSGPQRMLSGIRICPFQVTEGAIVVSEEGKWDDLESLAPTDTSRTWVGTYEWSDGAPHKNMHTKICAQHPKKKPPERQRTDRAEQRRE